jgi:hypothetical protein
LKQNEKNYFKIKSMPSSNNNNHTNGNDTYVHIDLQSNPTLEAQTKAFVYSALKSMGCDGVAAK